MKVITVKQFSNQAKAQMYKHRFDEEGIQCVISNTIVSTLIPMGAGSFSLQVLDDDLSKSIELIQELDALYMED